MDDEERVVPNDSTVAMDGVAGDAAPNGQPEAGDAPTAKRARTDTDTDADADTGVDAETNTATVPAPAKPLTFAEREPERAKVFQEELQTKKAALSIEDNQLPANHVTLFQRAKEYAAQWQDRYLTQKRQQEEMARMQAQQHKERMIALNSRLYVGGVVFELSRDDLGRIFEPFGFVRNVDMAMDNYSGRHKGFCFIEYEVPEAAAAALLVMSGAVLGGRMLRIGRPNNYPADLPNNGLPAPVLERIYVANVHPDLSEEDIQGVFEAFGPIKHVALVPEPIMRKHKTYGYIQYETVSAAEAAVMAMNGFELGGRRLTVTKTLMGGDMPPGMANMPPPPSAASEAGPGTPGQPGPPPGTSHLSAAMLPSVVNNPAIAAALEKANQKAAQVSATVSIPVRPPMPQGPPMLGMPHFVPHHGRPFPGPFGGPPPHHGQPPFMLQPHQGGPPQPAGPGSPSAAASAPAPAPAAGGAEPPARPEEPLTSEENMSIRGRQRYEVMQRLAARTDEPATSKSMVLRNMVAPDEVDDELEGEITEECSKFGPVQKVFIFVDNEDSNPETATRIFVTFATAEAAVKARDKFEGRYFAGRRIKAALYDDARLLAKDYSG